MTLRTLIFWPHLIAGVLAGAVILLMSVTGVLLTYERQLIEWADGHFHSEATAAGPIRPGALLTAFTREHPDLEPASLTIRSTREAPAVITSGRRTFYLDAYTGLGLGEASTGVRSFMSDVRGWHRWLSVDGEGRSTARAVTGWSNLLFLWIVGSGLYLWFPRRWAWSRVKPVVFFTGKLQGKARDFNWHNVIGAWSVVPLFIIVLTATPMSFPWANSLLFRAVGDPPPQVGRGQAGREGQAGRGTSAQPGNRPARGERDWGSLDAAWPIAEARVPEWRSISVRIPPSTEGPAVFSIDRGDGGQPQLRSTLTIDQGTGTVVAHETFAEQSAGRRLRSLARFAHTGEVLGLPGQTIAGLASAGAVVLVWTGIALAWRRLMAWRSRRHVRSLVEPPRESAA